jgi:simple sugar transport system permease protein
MTVTLDEGVVERPVPRIQPRRRLRWWGWLIVVLGSIAVVSAVRLASGAENLTSTGAIQSAITAAVPIALAGLSGLWSERSGVVNIGIEGMMILGTFGCGWAGYQWGPWVGVLCGVVCGALGGALLALATVTFGVDHIISGVAINIIAPGITLYLAKLLFTNAPGGGQKQSPPVNDVGHITIAPLSNALAPVEEKNKFFVSDLAGIIRGIVTDLSLITVLAAILIAVSGWILWRTRFGLRLRSCGEAPIAAETLGVNVMRYKYAAVLISGGVAGLAGATLVLGLKFQDGQTGGRGFIGLASMIFGNWLPGGMTVGASLFGYTQGVQLYDSTDTAIHTLLILIAIVLVAVAFLQWRGRHPGVGATALAIAVLLAWWFFATDTIPSQLVSAAPYAITILVMGLASQRLRPPKADGVPYRKGSST